MGKLEAQSDEGIKLGSHSCEESEPTRTGVWPRRRKRCTPSLTWLELWVCPGAVPLSGKCLWSLGQSRKGLVAAGLGIFIGWWPSSGWGPKEAKIMPLIFPFPRWQVQLHFMAWDDSTGWDRGMFAVWVLETQSLFLYHYLLHYFSIWATLSLLLPRPVQLYQLPWTKKCPRWRTETSQQCRRFNVHVILLQTHIVSRRGLENWTCI